MSYFDVDDILSEQDNLPCLLRSGIIKLGHLDTMRGEPDLAKGAKVELPLWLSRALAAKGYIHIDQPQPFSERYQNTLKADPRVVHLHEIAPYFYQFGLHYALLGNDVEVAHLLREVFQRRYERIMDLCHNASEDASHLTEHLDKLELNLFELGHEAHKAYRRWQRRSTDRMMPATALQRKRKRP
eukprot:m.37498 g.37498  ORF g.37498 m.37498 type:complete len:185 (-) comp5840_c0_seq1:1324-1878(-)